MSYCLALKLAAPILPGNMTITDDDVLNFPIPLINQRKQEQIKSKVEEAETDELKFDEVYYSVLQGEIIESYPDDKPYPSCLIFGRSFIGDPIHSVWGYNEETKWVVINNCISPRS